MVDSVDVTKLFRAIEYGEQKDRRKPLELGRDDNSTKNPRDHFQKPGLQVAFLRAWDWLCRTYKALMYCTGIGQVSAHASKKPRYARNSMIRQADRFQLTSGAKCVLRHIKDGGARCRRRGCGGKKMTAL